MADEQLGYEGERYTVIKNFWMPRGDTRDLIFEHDLGAAAAVKAARFQIKNSAGTVIMALTLADDVSQWDFATTDDEGTIEFQADDTASITEGSHNYAVELIDQSDRVSTPIKGVITLADDVVDNSGTSPYPSWTTLDDLETDISDMATCGNLSWLTVAATGGAMATLDVENGAIFTATDNIRLVLTNGSYEDDIVASMDSDEITLTGTIAGEAAIGAVVRIL